MSWWRKFTLREEVVLPEPNLERRKPYADVDWLVPWRGIDDLTRAAHLKVELAREMPKGHLLQGREPEFIAQRQDRDDFLLALEQGELAIVHLTWALETNPRFPGTALFPSFEEWRMSVMLPDAEDWEEREEEFRQSLN